MSMHITRQEVYLALAFAIMGFVFTTRQWLLWLNQFNPIQGMVIYYAILYTSLYLLSKAGLIIYKFKISSPTQTLGLLMITFAFFIVVDFSSAYVQYVTTGNLTGASVIYFQDEDGAVWYLFYNLLGITSIEIARLLSFVITPFLLVLGGSYLVTKPKIGA